MNKILFLTVLLVLVSNVDANNYNIDYPTFQGIWLLSQHDNGLATWDTEYLDVRIPIRPLPADNAYAMIIPYDTSEFYLSSNIFDVEVIYGAAIDDRAACYLGLSQLSYNYAWSYAASHPWEIDVYLEDGGTGKVMTNHSTGFTCSITNSTGVFREGNYLNALRFYRPIGGSGVSIYAKSNYSSSYQLIGGCDNFYNDSFVNVDLHCGDESAARTTESYITVWTVEGESTEESSINYNPSTSVILDVGYYDSFGTFQPIPGTLHLTRTEGLIPTTDSTSTSAFMWNVADLSTPKTYDIDLTASNFYYPGGYITFSLASPTRQAIMTPTNTTVMDNITVTVSGTVYGTNDAALVGAVLSSSCVMNRNTSRAGGVWELNAIMAGQYCTFTASYPGYVSDTINWDTFSDGTGADFHLTAQGNTQSRIDKTFFTFFKSLVGGQSVDTPVSGAQIRLMTVGYNTKYCTTINGVCTINNIYADAINTYYVTKTGYNTQIDTLERPLTSQQVNIMLVVTGQENDTYYINSLDGYVKVINGTNVTGLANILVTIKNDKGEVVSTVYTNDTGYYVNDATPGASYTVSTSYGSSSMSRVVTIPNGEGLTGRVPDMIFESRTTVRADAVEGFIDYIYGFMNLIKLIVFLFFIVVIFMFLNKMNIKE